MIRRYRNTRDFAFEAETLIAKELEARGWMVHREPRYGSLRPDVVAVDPKGNAYVIEIKGREHGSTPSFADIAQTKAYADITLEHNRHPRPVLVTNGEVSAALKSLSDALGVTIVVADDPADLANKVVSALRIGLQ